MLNEYKLLYGSVWASVSDSSMHYSRVIVLDVDASYVYYSAHSASNDPGSYRQQESLSRSEFLNHFKHIAVPDTAFTRHQ